MCSKRARAHAHCYILCACTNNVYINADDRKGFPVALSTRATSCKRTRDQFERGLIEEEEYGHGSGAHAREMWATIFKCTSDCIGNDNKHLLYSHYTAASSD